MKKTNFTLKAITGRTQQLVRSQAVSFNQAKVLLTFLLLAVSSVFAMAQTTYYVNDASTTGDVFTSAVGNDGNAGTASAPWATISHAIAIASTGDIIKVDVGTYNENVVLTKRLSLIGTGNTTVLTSASACAGGNTTFGILSNASGCKIMSLKVTNFDRGIVLQTTHTLINHVESVSNCNYGIALGLGASYTTIKNSKINNNGDGLHSSSGHHLKKLLVDSCEIKGNTNGTAIYATTSGNMYDSITISNCDFSNNTNKGMYFEKLSNALIENNIMNNSGNNSSYALNAGIDINLIHGSYSNITIQNNELTNCGVAGTSSNAATPAAMIIKGRDDGSLNGSLTNLIIRNNYIKGPVNGLRLGEVGQTNASPTNVTAVLNNFGNSFSNKAVNNLTTNSVTNASCNWYGTTVTAAINALINGSFNHTNNLVNGTDISSAVGFQPLTVLSVNAGVDKKVYYGYTTAYNTAVLTATVTQGSGSYTYSWSPGGATTASISVVPTTTTTYTVTVTDNNSCISSSNDAVVVTVRDVRCTRSGYLNPVLVCQATLIVPITTPRTFTYTQQCVAPKSVPSYLPPLAHGFLGDCNNPKQSLTSNTILANQMLVLPNPSTGQVTILMTLSEMERNINILNSVGQVVYETSTNHDSLELDLSNLPRGVYYISSSSSEGSAMKKLILN